MDQFLGEIRLFSFNLVPKGWAQCNGQILPIQQNQALFSLLGTFYGGDGVQTFALPNLAGRVPFYFGAGNNPGQSGGEANHTLVANEMPSHSHALNGSGNPADEVSMLNNLLAVPDGLLPYSNNPANFGSMDPSSITNGGSGQPHSNMQPYLALTYCIATQGIYPSRN